MPFGRLVERGAHDFRVHGTLHVRHFFGAFVDQQDDQFHFRVVPRDAVGDLLQENRLARLRRGNDHPALPLPYGGKEVHNPHGVFAGSGLELDVGVRVERRQVVEEDAFTDDVGILFVDRFHAEQSEEPLSFFRRTDLAAHAVPGAQVEFLDLRRGDVNVVGRGEIVVVYRTKEPVAVGEDFQDAAAERQSPLFCLSFEDLEYQFLLPEVAVSGNVEVLCNLIELSDFL